jgi:hypothetical protein
VNDVTPDLLGALARGVAIYPTDYDHHNSGPGSHVIAEAIRGPRFWGPAGRLPFKAMDGR